MQSPDIQALAADFNRAMQAHGAGRVTDAQAIYADILRRAPGHVGALHLLGVCHFQQGRFAEGVPLVQQAIALKPDYAEAHNNLGNGLKALGRFDEAIVHYRRALELRPTFADVANNLGVALTESGRPQEAWPQFERALALQPDRADTLNNAGTALARLGRHEEALALLQKAIALQPRYADAHNNLGGVLREMGRQEEARASFARAIEIRPDYVSALYNHGNALAALERPLEALDSYDRALAREPDNVQVLNNRGNVLETLRRPAEALQAFERVLEIRPGHVAALYNYGNALASMHRPLEALASYERALTYEPDNVPVLNNRGNVLEALQRPVEALASYDRALSLNPQWAEAWCNRANVMRDMHRFDEALSDYERALAVRSNYPAATFNRSILHLLRGDFAAGWPDYEERWRFPKFIGNSAGPLTADIIARLTLRPERAMFVGKRCLVVGEQGLGDQVMFASLLGDLARDAVQVICLVDRKLVGLLARTFPAIQVRDIAQPHDGLLDGVDHILAIGSLAHAYRKSVADFSGAPYLTPSAEKVAAWRGRLGAGQGRPLVGLSWRGGTVDSRSASRSLALDDLLPALDAVDARFVSLQYGDVADEVAAFNARHGRDVLCLPRAEIEDFDDLAALVCALDGVLSVQTALIHLCGALGRECLTLVPRQPEWRYGLTGESMPWYRSVSLLRQGDDGAWAPVVARAAGRLRAIERP